MMEIMGTETGISTNKFQEVVHEVGIAFEATLPASKPLSYSAEFAFLRLVHSKPNETVVRVNFPAILEGNLSVDAKSIINFIPWVDLTDAQFYRLVFRIQPKGNNIYRKLCFGRFGEEKPFSFNPRSKGGSFISLQFLGYGTTEFNPVYLKVETDSIGIFKYYKVSAHGSDVAVKVVVEEVTPEQTPQHLQSAIL